MYLWGYFERDENTVWLKARLLTFIKLAGLRSNKEQTIRNTLLPTVV